MSQFYSRKLKEDQEETLKGTEKLERSVLEHLEEWRLSLPVNQQPAWLIPRSKQHIKWAMSFRLFCLIITWWGKMSEFSMQELRIIPRCSKNFPGRKRKRENHPVEGARLLSQQGSCSVWGATIHSFVYWLLVAAFLIRQTSNRKPLFTKHSLL